MTDQTALDAGLEPGLSIFDRRRLFSDRAVWTYLLVGLALVITAATGLWEKTGYLVDEGAGVRYIVVLVAALYGFGLGWIIFPRTGPLRDV